MTPSKVGCIWWLSVKWQHLQNQKASIHTHATLTYSYCDFTGHQLQYGVTSFHATWGQTYFASVLTFIWNIVHVWPQYWSPHHECLSVMGVFEGHECFECHECLFSQNAKTRSVWKLTPMSVWVPWVLSSQNMKTKVSVKNKVSVKTNTHECFFECHEYLFSQNNTTKASVKSKKKMTSTSETVY